jgi:hypothetical protein
MGHYQRFNEFLQTILQQFLKLFFADGISQRAFVIVTTPRGSARIGPTIQHRNCATL